MNKTALKGSRTIIPVLLLAAGVWTAVRLSDPDPGSGTGTNAHPGSLSEPGFGHLENSSATAPGSLGERSGNKAKGGGSARALTHEQITALGREFRESEDSTTRRLAFERLLRGLTAENADAIREQMAHLSPYTKEFRKFYHAWGRIGGEGAVQSAANQSKHASRAAMAGWASENPEAAQAFFDGLELRGRNAEGSISHVTQDDLRLGLAHGLGEADPDLAAEFIADQFGAKLVGHKEVGSMIREVTNHMALEEGLAAAGEWAVAVEHPLRAEAIAGVARAYAAEDPHAAIEWLKSIEGKGFLGAAYYHTFDTWMREEPAQATEFITTMPDSRDRNEAISALVQRTIGEDPELALGWAENITEDSFRHRKFRDAFNTWVHHDPEKASTYLAGMPSSPERDYAIQGFASTLVKDDPAAAIAWVDAIGDLRMRDSALTWVGMAYLENDPAAATAWLPESGLSQEMVERVLDPPPEDRHLWRFLTHQ
jgi:hypothetical protein